MTTEQRIRVIQLLDELLEGDDNEFHMGDCVGADTQFHSIVWGRGKRIGHPPDIDKKRAFLRYDIEHEPLPYMSRNMNIVKWGVNGLIATPYEDEEVVRSGTWSTVRRARLLSRFIYLVFRDGSLNRE